MLPDILPSQLVNSFRGLNRAPGEPVTRHADSLAFTLGNEGEIEACDQDSAHVVIERQRFFICLTSAIIIAGKASNLADDRQWGLLLIINASAAIIHHIEFFKPVAYLDGDELSYLIYDPAERGKGVITEAVRLAVRIHFDTKKANRLQLVIHPHNMASRRVAEKSGFVDEGTMRGAWYHRGQYHDVEVYALLRGEHGTRRNTEPVNPDGAIAPWSVQCDKATIPTKFLLRRVFSTTQQVFLENEICFLLTKLYNLTIV